jgi:hypothetical protein
MKLAQVREYEGFRFSSVKSPVQDLQSRQLDQRR